MQEVLLENSILQASGNSGPKMREKSEILGFLFSLLQLLENSMAVVVKRTLLSDWRESLWPEGRA